MKPIIGIVVRSDININKYFLLNKEVCQSVIKYGGIPIGICESDDINLIINICDGFILQGGDDFTNFDINLIKKIKELNKPLFGICLGMQTMGYVFNGEIKHLEDHTHKLFSEYVHYINIMPGTHLFKILGKNRILVNSRHMDCLEKTGLRISAMSDDNVIEAIEDTNHKFFIGVQWHPESVDDNISKLLFSEFIKLCGR